MRREGRITIDATRFTQFGRWEGTITYGGRRVAIDPRRVYGTKDRSLLLPRLSQETLAEMVGTTRSRVNFFMNKFRDLGFIEYNGEIKVNSSLLTVVLHD